MAENGLLAKNKLNGKNSYEKELLTMKSYAKHLKNMEQEYILPFDLRMAEETEQAIT